MVYLNKGDLRESLNDSIRYSGQYFGYPHPCGFLGDARRECRCYYLQIQRYRSKISGPLMDRIVLHMEIKSLLRFYGARLRRFGIYENSQEH
ncbi:MAG: ATP-binding protein [Deltaproteobacteria bacterium]|nr:ATP-binding protein [Deltaproteobacteria bacterium]